MDQKWIFFRLYRFYNLKWSNTAFFKNIFIQTQVQRWSCYAFGMLFWLRITCWRKYEFCFMYHNIMQNIRPSVSWSYSTNRSCRKITTQNISKSTREWMKRNKFSALEWPTQTLDLNPTEILCKIRNKSFLLENFQVNSVEAVHWISA